MKKAFLISTLIITLFAIDLGNEFNFLTQSDYGKKIISDQQLIQKQSQNVLDLISNLNRLESEIVMESEKIMKDHQTFYTRNIERKQELKQKIFLSKYQQQNIGEELQIVSKEKEFATKIYEQRKKLLTEENKFVPQMQAIRNDEIDKLQEQKKEIQQTKKVLNSFSQTFNNLAHFLSKKPDLNEQSTFLGNNKQNEDLNKFRDICNEIRSDLDTVVIDNPYTLVLFSLKPLLATENAHLVEEVPQLLKNLILALDSSLEEVEAVSNERQELFTIEKTELKKDIDKRTNECDQIKILLDRSIQDEQKLNDEQSELKKKITQLQTEQQQLQSDMEGQQRDYRSKIKFNLSNLETIRKVKYLMSQNSKGYLMFLKNAK